jgi:hypothetical protein
MISYFSSITSFVFYCSFSVLGIVSTFIGLPLLYQKISNLNDLRKAVQLTDKLNKKKTNILSSLYKTIKLLYKSLINICYKHIYGLSRISKNTYYISYFHNMKWYNVPIKIKRGPKKKINKAIELVTNINVTEFVITFAGPSNDFYGSKVTPNDIGMSDIEITVDDVDYLFKANDEIIF